MEWSAMEPTKIRYGLIATLVAVVLALSAADLLLARIENRETHAEALRYYQAGGRLLDSGRATEAIDPLRKAHAMDRYDNRYALRLGEALIGAGKFDEAQTMLTEILERTPNDGEANLREAQLLARRGQSTDAAAYYHRAIYGAWSGDRHARTIEARLELANLYAANGFDKELLAELLPLETEAHDDLTIRKQIARLFMAANAPSRAQAAYRALVGDGPGDSSNYEGLGEAELALGNYRDAETAFQNAGSSDQADRAAEMAELDPTIRRLSSAEKFRRSVQILTQVRDVLASCAADSQSHDLLDAADKEITARVRGAITNELAEERLALAEQLWRQRKAACASSTASDDALARLMQKLGAS
jgi:tetratricopeptide (TPR) repeat protein